MREGIETRADRVVEPARTDGDDDASEEIGIDTRPDFDRAAFARTELLFERTELLAGQPRGEASATGRSEPELTHQFAVSEDDVELALLREKQKRVQS